MDKPGEIKLWNAASGKELFTLQDPGAVAVFGLAFSPDGRRIVTSSVAGTAKVYYAEPPTKTRR